MRISLLSLAVAAVFTAKNTPQTSASLLSVSQAAHLEAALKRDPPYRLPGLMNFGLPEQEVYALLLQESVRHEMEHGDRDCVGMVGEESSRYLSEPEELPSDEMKLKLMVDINTQRCLHDAPMIPWSDCTARGAQKWASQDRVEPLASYLEPPCGGPAGRAYSWGVPTVDEAVQTWMNEEDLWEEGAQKSYNPAAANYTTMVWRGVRNFGCGWEANQQLLICHFKADDYFNCRTPLTEGCFEYHVHRRNDMSECDCRNEAVTFAHTQLNLNVPELPNCSETTTTTEVPRDWWKDWVGGKPTQPPHTALTADQDQVPTANPSIFQRLRAQFTGIQTNLETETGMTGEATPNRPVKGVISAQSIFEPGSWMIDPTKTDPNSLQTASGVNAVIDTQVPRFKNGSEPFRTLKIEFPTEQPSVGGFNLVQKQDQVDVSVSLLEQSNTTTVATTTAQPKVDQEKWAWEGVWGPGMVPNAPVKTQTQTTATKLSLRTAGGGLVRRHGFVL